MSDEVYRDIAVAIGDETEDAWDAMAASYEYVSRLIIAILQRTGRRRLPADWFDLAEGFVMIAHPQSDGGYVLEAVRRGEVKSDTADGAERLREKWERTYIRRAAS